MVSAQRWADFLFSLPFSIGLTLDPLKHKAFSHAILFRGAIQAL